MVRSLSSSEYSTMFGGNFQIYNVQITGICILWNYSHLAMIWPYATHCRTIPTSPRYKFVPQSMSPHGKLFWKKLPLPHTLVGDDNIKGSSKIRMKAKGNSWNSNNFMARYCHNCTFLEGVSFKQHNEF